MKKRVPRPYPSPHKIRMSEEIPFDIRDYAIFLVPIAVFLVAIVVTDSNPLVVLLGVVAAIVCGAAAVVVGHKH